MDLEQVKGSRSDHVTDRSTEREFGHSLDRLRECSGGSGCVSGTSVVSVSAGYNSGLRCQETSKCFAYLGG